MKLRMKSFIPAALTALLFFASCQKKDVPQTDPPVKDPISVSINAEMGEFASTVKSTGEACIRMKWESGDEVYAYGLNSSSQMQLLSDTPLSVALVDGDPYRVTISGSLSAIPEDKKLYLLHSPLCSSAPSFSEGKASIDMKTQSSPDVIPFVAYAFVDNVTAESVSSLNARFKFATSIIKVNVVGLGNSEALSNVTINDCNTVCTLTFSDGTVTVGSADKSSTASKNVITRTLSCSTSGTGKASFYIAVPKQASGGIKTVTVTSANSQYQCRSTALGTGIAENKYINTILNAPACPEGALSGLFTIDATGTRVRFARGNMYCDTTKSPVVYSFEASQCDFRHYPGLTNDKAVINGTSDMTTPDGTVGSFFWDKNADVAYRKVYSGILESIDDVFFTNNLNNGNTPNPDFTVNGQKGIWRVLTGFEWGYLLNVNSESQKRQDSCRFAMANVNGHKGLIIFPDGYSGTIPSAGMAELNNQSTIFPSTPMTADDWTAMESAGCVFLPVAGLRGGISTGEYYCEVYWVHEGYYYDAFCNGLKGYSLLFADRCGINIANVLGCSKGASVRLVTVVQ